MTACESIHHIFDKPLPSWKPIQKMKTKSSSSSIVESSSFTDIFGELHFQESSDTTASSPINLSPESSFPSPPFVSENHNSNKNNNNNSNSNNNNNRSCASKSESDFLEAKEARHSRYRNSFSSVNSDTLSVCTEGLGFESSDDVEDYVENDSKQEVKARFLKHKKFVYPLTTLKRSRTCDSGTQSRFPPPISSIGSSGKPWVCFKSFRHNGRFILKEVRVPTQEFMHACREDGRLKLQFIQSSDDEYADDDDDDDEDTGDESGNGNDGDRDHNTEDKKQLFEDQIRVDRTK